jgi:hypothetical protein
MKISSKDYANSFVYPEMELFVGDYSDIFNDAAKHGKENELLNIVNDTINRIVIENDSYWIAFAEWVFSGNGDYLPDSKESLKVVARKNRIRGRASRANNPYISRKKDAKKYAIYRLIRAMLDSYSSSLDLKTGDPLFPEESLHLWGRYRDFFDSIEEEDHALEFSEGLMDCLARIATHQAYEIVRHYL